MSSFISQNSTEIDALLFVYVTLYSTCSLVYKLAGSHFFVRQLLKFHPLDWLIEIYLQTEDQGTQHKKYRSNQCLVFPSVVSKSLVF